MSLAEDHAKLTAKLAELEAHKRRLREVKRQLQERAVRMHDATHDAVDGWSDAVDAGRAGILGQRRLRTLLTERSRLAAIAHEAEGDGDA